MSYFIEKEAKNLQNAHIPDFEMEYLENHHYNIITEDLWH